MIENSLAHINLQSQTPDINKAKSLSKLKEKSDDFEAMVLKELLDISMKESKNSLFGESTGSEIYSSMYHDALGKEISGGFGYSELLFNFLKKNI